MSTTPSSIVSYTDILEIKSELGLQQNNLGQWIMWQIPIDGEVIEHYVQQANEQTTNKFGNLSGNGTIFPLAKQYATKWATLHLVQTLSFNWQISGMAMGVGNLSINRLPALQAAANMIIDIKTKELAELYNMLVDTSMILIDSYTSTSPYIQTGGSFFFP